MKYSTFERLVATVGFAAVIASVVLSVQDSMPAEEIVAQFLLLGVLLASVHWGRNGGFISALAASGIYLVMRIPLVLGDHGLTGDVTSLVLTRLFTYGLTGIVGGELCGRVKHIFARLEGAASIDDWSLVYNQRFMLRALESARGQYSRYDTPYSAITIELSPKLTQDLRASRQRAMIRGVADHVRHDLRLVDEVGRLDDGRFLVVLPQTPYQGALVVAERLRAGVCETLGAKEESIVVHTLAAPEDDDQLNALTAELSVIGPPLIYTEESGS